MSTDNLANRLAHRLQRIHQRADIAVSGRLTRVVGLTLEAVGIHAPLGALCRIVDTDRVIEAEVIGFANETLYLMSSDSAEGIRLGARVELLGSANQVAVGPGLLGRVINGAGVPLDDQGPIVAKQYYPLMAEPLNPLSRKTIAEPLDVGVRAINGLLTIGQGQRVGLFAGSGVGKSVLLGMMTRYTQADVVVVGLIGERGREVKEFIEHSLGSAGMQRAVVVASPSDTSPLMRLHGAMSATSIAEYFRDQGANVLLLVDSLTRFAHAQRQIGLSIGEPPTSKGYPPSVYTKLSQLVERAGNAEQGKGSITAIYTVLAEGDDQQDPVVDAVRSFLDGHIVLTRRLADASHYPAIDIDASISRVMTAITTPEHQAIAQQFKQLHAHFGENRDLINLGAYQAGSDALLDQAIALFPQMSEYLQQKMDEQADVASSISGLSQVLSPSQGGLPSDPTAKPNAGHGQAG